MLCFCRGPLATNKDENAVNYNVADPSRHFLIRCMLSWRTLATVFCRERFVTKTVADPSWQFLISLFVFIGDPSRQLSREVRDGRNHMDTTHMETYFDYTICSSSSSSFRRYHSAFGCLRFDKHDCMNFDFLKIFQNRHAYNEISYGQVRLCIVFKCCWWQKANQCNLFGDASFPL